MHHQMLRLEATLAEVPDRQAAAPPAPDHAGAAAGGPPPPPRPPAARLAELATHWVRGPPRMTPDSWEKTCNHATQDRCTEPNVMHRAALTARSEDRHRGCEREECVKACVTHCPQARQAAMPNARLGGEKWLADVAWDADGAARLARRSLRLDLNDPGLTFRLRRGADPAALANAPATILPPLPKVGRAVDGDRMMRSAFTLCEPFHDLLGRLSLP